MIELLHKLEAAWCADTSATPEGWSADNAALGQCAVTALVVQDFMGGELLRGLVPGGSHYWNRLPAGVEIDLTIQQFAKRPDLRSVEIRSRDYLLSSPSTAARYKLLRASVCSK